MSYLALPDSPMSTLVVNWLVFDNGLAGVEVIPEVKIPRLLFLVF